MEFSGSNLLFKDPYKYKYSKVYTDYILGLINYEDALKQEEIQTTIMFQKQQHSINERYIGSGLVPIGLETDGRIKLGYIDGVEFDRDKYVNVNYYRISICDYFSWYEDVYGPHPDILPLPIKTYTESVVNEAIRLKAADMTLSVSEGFIRFYFNISKRKVWSKIKIKKEFLKEAVQSLIQYEFDTAKRDSYSGKVKLDKSGNIIGRVELVPTHDGECMITTRLTEVKPLTQTPDDLGLSPATTKFINEVFCDTENGLRIIVGPTMSGKNTTVCAALNKYVREDKWKIVSIESPIERILYGVEQIEATNENVKEVCDSMIRSNPDILYPSELNDRTGGSIIDIANTGKIVFSTAHANSVSTTFLRLERITGLPRDVLLQVVHSVIYQELIQYTKENGELAVSPKCRYIHITKELRKELTGLNDKEFYERIEQYELGDAFKSYTERTEIS